MNCLLSSRHGAYHYKVLAIFLLRRRWGYSGRPSNRKEIAQLAIKTIIDKERRNKGI